MDLQEQLDHWLNIQSKKRCYRQLMIVSGPEDWACKQAQNIVTDCQLNAALWVGKRNSSQKSVEAKMYRSFLGQEFSALIFNCYSGFRANAIMALSGTVKSRGLMLVLCPDLSIWAKYPDPEHKQKTSFGYESDNRESNFISFLVDQIKRDTNVSILTPENLTGSPTLVPQNYASHKINGQSEEQSQAIELIVRTAVGHAHRPLVLSADRGRGKSSALGIAAARLINDHGKKIILSAPSFNTVEHVFLHAREALPGADSHKQAMNTEHGSLQFMPVDALLSESATADFVMIDEAAALPTSLLKKIIAKYSRVVFSTTLHGYEGSGRGFELRFKKHLNAACPDWKTIHLTQPIRWYPEDVLERFWFRCMLMEKQSSRVKMVLSSSSVDIIEVNTEALVNDEQMLTNIFQLLVNAHYQTTPDDLVRLLDAPEQRLFILKQQDNLLGIALISEEGGAELQSLSTKIASGSRRVKGHLVPQYLTLHCGDLGLCNYKQWRIVRIVIEPDRQTKGLGTLLLNEIEKVASTRKIEFLTSAFGATSQLLNFWQKSLFNVAKMGFKKDASSGEHSAIVLKPLTREARILTTELIAIFNQDVQYQTSRHFAEIDTHLLVTLLKYCPNNWIPNKNEIKLIVQFIENMRPLYSCELVLAKLLKLCLCNYQQQLNEDYVFLVAVLLQFKNDKTLCWEFSLSGKQQIQQRAQQAVNNLYSEISRS